MPPFSSRPHSRFSRKILPRQLLVASALLLGLAAAPAAQAQFCQGALGDPIGMAAIPLNVDQFGDIQHYTVVVFGTPKSTYKDDVPTMDVTVYAGPSPSFRCLVLERATPPIIRQPFMREFRFLLKTDPTGGDVIDEIRFLADLETGELATTSPVNIEIQEVSTPLMGGETVEKSKMITIPMSTGTVVRPRCGNNSEELVEGEPFYSERGEFTLNGAECIDEFGGAQGFDARFLFRISGAMTVVCQDGYDNDGDGDTDLDDPGCMDEFDITEELSCANGLDDDGDGQVDFPGDPGCASEEDDSEKDPLLECDDGLDNDGDELIDFPEDPECLSSLSPTEVPEPALALLQAAALGLVAALRGRRQ